MVSCFRLVLRARLLLLVRSLARNFFYFFYLLLSSMLITSISPTNQVQFLCKVKVCCQAGAKVANDGSFIGTVKSGRIRDSSNSLIKGLGHRLTWFLVGCILVGFNLDKGLVLFSWACFEETKIAEYAGDSSSIFHCSC